LNESGEIVDNTIPDPLKIGPQKQLSVFLHDLLPARQRFRGSMVLVAQGGKRFAAVSLVLNGGLLTVVPVIPGRAPNVPG
jgi:hypothetical protein